MRCSICHAVMPLTSSVSTAAGSASSGTGTRSRASRCRWLVQAPVFVTAANLPPRSAGSTPGPTSVTVPTTS
ncbi:hypothetical protein ABZ234_00455 [Nocardiopsis sp. NPDC006198]|uniref:hypothetical protein n=1 Tax=Nocardiopsis sp. NPDC006198 TaxID=3154472 RepID=UPI0033AA43F3